MKPRIGITSNYLFDNAKGFEGSKRIYVNQDYVDCVRKAGGIPVILAISDTHDEINAQLETIDGLIVMGGYDVSPYFYNEDPLPECGYTNQEVDYYYLNIITRAAARNIPVFGICKGIQSMNVAFGGTLYQDIETQIPNAIKHVQNTQRYYPSHAILVEKDSFLYDITGSETLVNSYHHQAVKDVASGFKVTAKAKDGVVEMIEYEGDRFLKAVQFHPEMMGSSDHQEMLDIFRKFIDACQK